MLITSPLKIKPGKTARAKKSYILNLNNYPNWHYQTYNNIKKAYKRDMESQLSGVQFDKPIQLTFIYYPGSARASDRANVLCVHEKFFCDALVEYGCLPDDTDEYIHSSHYYSGEIDRTDPRVEIWIEQVV